MTAGAVSVLTIVFWLLFLAVWTAGLWLTVSLLVDATVWLVAAHQRGRARLTRAAAGR